MSSRSSWAVCVFILEEDFIVVVISWGGGLIEYLYGDRCGFFFRRSVTAGSVEAAIFIISMGDHREIYGSWVFGAEAIQHVSSTSWRTKARRASWAKMSPYVFGVYTVLILWGFRNQFNCSVLCDSPLGFNVKIKWESKKLKIRCFLCIWRLATYVIILYKPYSLSGYCDNWISQSKNISENILRDYSDFDLFVTTTVLWVRKSIPLALFEVFRLRKLMRPCAASDIFYKPLWAFQNLSFGFSQKMFHFTKFDKCFTSQNIWREQFIHGLEKLISCCFFPLLATISPSSKVALGDWDNRQPLTSRSSRTEPACRLG